MFVGFKADKNLCLRLESLSDVDRNYVSSDASGFLRICRVGEDTYVGKVVRESLTTNQVDDIRRNILSIIRKLGPLVRLPGDLKILACTESEADAPLASAQIVSPRTVPIEPVSRPAVR
jgi:hypothetical protein